jgi:hypothetical protein
MISFKPRSVPMNPLVVFGKETCRPTIWSKINSKLRIFNQETLIRHVHGLLHIPDEILGYWSSISIHQHPSLSFYHVRPTQKPMSGNMNRRVYYCSPFTSPGTALASPPEIPPIQVPSYISSKAAAGAVSRKSTDNSISSSPEDHNETYLLTHTSPANPSPT